MRLGFDLDEVVVALNKEVEKYVAAEYGIDWSQDCITSYGFGDEAFHPDKELNDKMVKDIIPLLDDADFQSPAEPVPGALEGLKELYRTGHKIFFISSRPPENRDKTIAWLIKHKVKFEDAVTVGHQVDKGIYGRKFNLDMYVDDLVRHLKSMAEYKKSWKKGLLLFDRPWNCAPVDGNKYKRVYNWREIIRHIGIQNR